MDRFRLLIVGSGDENLAASVKHISVGVNDHVDLAATAPVLRVIITVSDSKGAHACISLLQLFALHVDDRESSKFTRTVLCLAISPISLGDLNEVVLDFTVCQEHEERTGAAVPSIEVLNSHILEKILAHLPCVRDSMIFLHSYWVRITGASRSHIALSVAASSHNYFVYK